MASMYHPATRQLLHFQGLGKFERMSRTLKDRRRRWLAVLGIILAVLWLSQTVAAILFRESADPEDLRIWLPLGLACYAIWHGIKLFVQQPDDPYHWTPAEREWVLGAPLSRSQIITYRMLAIAKTALAKTACFSILMLPDIPVWYLGFVGMLMGLFLVDLIRINLELLFAGLTKTLRKLLKCLTLLTVGLGALTLTLQCLTQPNANADLSSPAALVFFQNLFHQTLLLAQSPFGQLLLAPFQQFSEVALAKTVTTKEISQFLVGGGLLLCLFLSTYRLDGWMLRQQAVLEKRSLTIRRRFKSENPKRGSVTGHQARVRIPWRLAGIGSVAWRQALGVVHYRSAITFSLAVPIFLSCLPLLANHQPQTMLLHLVASAVFYSFLLLPAALMLDYRRDLNRMAVLKSLPMTPLAVTLGQLATPVMVAWFFQALVLAIGWSVGSVHGFQCILAFLLLFPVNVLIFSVENYIFLLSPYHRNREGIDVFLRTILTFTGKGLLFAIGLLVVLAWSMLAITIARSFGMSPRIATVVFGSGIWLITLAAASFFVRQTTIRFDQFDPSQDVPGR